MKERRELPANPSYLTKEVLLSWNEGTYNYKMEFSGGDDLRVVMFGEIHGVPEMIHAQVDLIYKVNPSFVLHEGAGGWIYNPQSGQFERQPRRRFNETDLYQELIAVPSALKSASHDLGFQIVGCDLTDAEICDAFRNLAQTHPERYCFYEIFGMQILEDRADPERVITDQSDEIIPYREHQMVQTIEEYQEIAERPIIVILGNYHANNLHRDLLKDKGFGYAYVDQTKGFRYAYVDQITER